MNFKVKCVAYHDNRNPQIFTVGKVYEVKNGRIVSDNGDWYEGWSLDSNGNGDFKALKKWFAQWCDLELVEDKKVFTKKDLKTGMFGYVDDNIEDWFVIVDNNLIYQKGCMDEIYRLNDDLKFPSGRKITALYDADCFNIATSFRGKLIWERKPLYNGKVVCVEVTPANRDLYTVGKIYQFNNGKITADNGYLYPSCTEIHSFEDWDNFSYCKFIEIVE